MALFRHNETDRQVRAVQFDAKQSPFNQRFPIETDDEGEFVSLRTRRGLRKVRVSDWIITPIRAPAYTLPANVFEKVFRAL